MTHEIWNLPTWDEFSREQIEELLNIEPDQTITEIIKFQPVSDIENLYGLWEIQKWLWGIRRTLWPDALNRKILRVMLRHLGRTGQGHFPVVAVANPSREPFSAEELRLDAPLQGSVTLIEKNFSDSAWLYALAEESGNLFGWPGYCMEEVVYTDHFPVDSNDEDFPYEKSFTSVSILMPELDKYLDWSTLAVGEVESLLAKLIKIEETLKAKHGDLPVDSYDIQILLSSYRHLFKSA